MFVVNYTTLKNNSAVSVKDFSDSRNFEAI